MTCSVSEQTSWVLICVIFKLKMNQGVSWSVAAASHRCWKRWTSTAIRTDLWAVEYLTGLRGIRGEAAAPHGKSGKLIFPMLWRDPRNSLLESVVQKVSPLPINQHGTSSEKKYEGVMSGKGRGFTSLWPPVKQWHYWLFSTHKNTNTSMSFFNY